jgi:hypothetical protein
MSEVRYMHAMICDLGRALAVLEKEEAVDEKK